MADEREVINNDFSKFSRDLFTFMDELKASGYQIGTNQFMQTQALLVALAARGELPTDWRQLKTMIGPVICSSPDQQEDFATRFEQWVNLSQPVDSAPRTPPLVEAELKKFATGREWIRLAYLLMVALLSLCIIFVTLTVLEVMTRISLGTWSVVLFGILILFCLLRFLWRSWASREAARFLERRSAAGKQQTTALPLGMQRSEIFAPSRLAHIGQLLRRRRAVDSNRLDVDKTLAKTIENAGRFSPVQGEKQLVPEYLVLIDRASARDHHCHMADEWLAGLKEHEVFISRYEFRGDPRSCFVENVQRPLTLQDLAAKHPEHRLMLFSDAATLTNPLTGDLAAWTEQFQAWKDRTVLTPRSPFEWGYREWALTRAGFLVATASRRGLAAFASQIAQSDVRADLPNDESISPPALLDDRPRRWLATRSPSEHVVQKLCAQLRAYLGPAGYDWLTACAVFPTLEWPLTLVLGQTIKDRGGQPLLGESRLAALTRLPWLRYGTMPDWLREALLSQLSTESEREVRAAVGHYLIAPPSESTANQPLEIAHAQQQPIASLANQMIRRWNKEEPDDDSLRDYVFVTFMKGRKPGKLAYRIPKALGKLLEPRAKPPLAAKLFEEITAAGEVPDVEVSNVWEATADEAAKPADRPARKTKNDGIVFISYRRDDAQFAAQRIGERLTNRFGPDSVFMDVDSIPLGTDFSDVIGQAVARASVLLAIMGEDWLASRGGDGRPRLHDPNDFVRMEIEQALQRGIPVIPVLIGNARMPLEEELPESLRGLVYYQFVTIRPDPEFAHDMDRLLHAIKLLGIV